MPETKTYRGDSVEALLPKIREELGAEAVITRRREGVVGGIGGFFGKKCVEIEARGPLPVPTFVPTSTGKPTIPPSAIVDVYDGPGEEDEPADETSPLLEALLAQASPFAVELAEAVGAANAVELPDEIETVELPKLALTESPIESFEELQAALEQALTEAEADPEPQPEPEARPEVEEPIAAPAAADPAAVRVALARAGIADSLAKTILDEAEHALAPFAPDEPFANHVRQALARRVRVANGGGARRRIVLVGPAGAGRTAAAARLCTAFARTGASVSALSLEPARAALELAAGTDGARIGFHVADTPAAVAAKRRELQRTQVVVADTPAIDPAEPARMRKLSQLLDELGPSETHLVVAAGTSVQALRRLVEALKKRGNLDGVVLTHADDADAAATPVGVALTEGVPISYVATSPGADGGLRPAEPFELARLVLR